MARRNERELVLSYERDRWLATGSDFTVSGADLLEIESSIERVFRSRPVLAAQLPARIQLRFDHSTLPRWLRQYQAHYFNHAFDVRPGGTDR